MFKIGQTAACAAIQQGSIVICVDAEANHSLQGKLLRFAQYIVEDYSDCFVKIEGVKGEWHETRFILAESL